MRLPLVSLLLLPALSSLLLACGSGGECAQAFDKEIECDEDPAAAKERAKAFREKAIAQCEENKSEPRIKTALKCGKEKTCEAFNACKLEARSADDIKEINEKLASDPTEAMKICTYSLDTYKAVDDFKAVCDKAFTAAFSDLSDKEKRDDVRFTCASSSKASEWLAASETLKKGCVGLQDDFKKLVVTQRNAGTEFDYSTCASYKDLVKALTPDGLPAAELLCEEADKADDLAKAMAAAKTNIDAKKGEVPFECKYFLDDKAKFGKSEWFATKSAELAKLCFADLGKIALAGVTSYCPMDAKNTHAFATEYKLGDADPELKALLDKTAGKCL